MHLHERQLTALQTSAPQRPALWGRLLACFAVWLCCCPAGRAQQRAAPLSLEGLEPAGVRTTTTESWGTLKFNLVNSTDTDRRARVLVFFESRRDVQYGRDVWVPARSTLRSWMLVGPADAQAPAGKRKLETLLYDRSEERDRLNLPRDQERVRTLEARYRKREPFTTILLDEEPPEERAVGQLPRPDSAAAEALLLVRTFRRASYLPEFIERIFPGAFPATAEAFDGIDHLVLASDWVARDPVGMRALRHWLQRGGRVWVMLDQVGPEVVAPLLGEEFDFQVVDRVPLTSFRIASSGPHGKKRTTEVEQPLQQHDRPVDFVRVLLPPEERPRHTINGWPAWFSRQVGTGQVVFTTLGPRGWFSSTGRAAPVASDPLEAVADELQRPAEAPIPDEVFAPMLAEEIGYKVLGRGTVGLILAGFLLATLGLGIVLRRSRRPELLGWLAPAAALGAAVVFALLGQSSRQAAPPTVAVAQVVDAGGGSEEAAVHGLLAMYRPESGPADVGADRGGLFELDMAGIEGQTRRLILSDMDRWQWENLALPAGVRLAPVRQTLPTPEPMTAVARFGPEGVEGKLTAGPFTGLGDVLLATPSGRNLAVRLREDGAFSTGTRDMLPAGQFLDSPVLT